MLVEFGVEAHPDEFGVVDGRELARDLVALAYRLLVPYAHGCPRCADMLFLLVSGETVRTLQHDAEREGGLLSAMVSVDEPGPRQRVMTAAHIEASDHETRRLLQRADALHDH